VSSRLSKTAEPEDGTSSDFEPILLLYSASEKRDAASHERGIECSESHAEITARSVLNGNSD